MRLAYSTVYIQWRLPFVLLCVFFLNGAMLSPVFAQDSLKFETVKTKTFEKEKFLFPDDMRGNPVNIVFLAMSNTRESGEAQQLALLEWNAELEQAGAFSDQAMPYHFIVMESPPFFVKGMITRAMRDVYEGQVPLNQSAVIYVDDLVKFASAAGIEVDGQATVVIVSNEGAVLVQVKGDVSEVAVSDFLESLNQYVNSEAS
jgi:hypothetical protein